MRDFVERFRVGPELGARLRQIRRDAGLALAQLASRMDRPNKFYYTQLSQLERGKIPGVSLATVMDYLRACRASIHDVADILDRYTDRPVVPEERARARLRDEGGGMNGTESGSRAAALHS